MSAYGYDSRRRRTARRVAYWAGTRRRFAFWFRALLIVGLLGLAVFAIVWDRQPRPLDFPLEKRPTGVTATLSPVISPPGGPPAAG